ncbi:MAG: hypothetical protein AAF960_29865, partial [Bacteroidota bacterium]
MNYFSLTFHFPVVQQLLRHPNVSSFLFFYFFLFLPLRAAPIAAQPSYQQIVDSLGQTLPSIQTPLRKVDVLNEIAYTYRRISGDSTLKYAKLANQLATLHNYVGGQSIAHKNMGIGHYKLNSPKDSMVFHYKKAIRLAQEVGDYYTQAACNNNIAVLSSHFENPYEAIKHYLRGIEIFNQHI